MEMLEKSTFEDIAIKSKKSSPIIIIIFSVFTFLSAIIPIIATVFLIQDEDGLQFGLLFGFIIFYAVGYYFLRIALRHAYGKEILHFDNESIHYYADYKYFNGSHQEINIKDLDVSIINNNKDIDMGILLLVNEKTSIETVIETNILELEKIKEKIQSIINQF